MRHAFWVAAVFGLQLLVGFANAQDTALTIGSISGVMKLVVAGEAGHDYMIQATTNPGSTNAWQSLLTLSLSNASQWWLDSGSTLMPTRFYRAVKLLSPTPAEHVMDFRLIDHQNVSHELNYERAARAVVLVITRFDLPTTPQTVSTVQSLDSKFSSQGVKFWFVDANPQDTRSNLVAYAATLGITIPILQDETQLVTQELATGIVPEAIGINTMNWEVFYRGALDDRVDSTTQPTTQTYLANALTGFLAGQPVSPIRTRPIGTGLSVPELPSTSYSMQIAPLLQAKCFRCHNPGNIAPWTMTNYAVVKAFAGAIKQDVLAKRMPPWHADSEYGAFTNDFSLKPEEARLLVQWIDSGAPRGDGLDPLAAIPPPATNYPYGWPASLGQPDAILSIPSQSIPANGILNYRNLSVPTSFSSNVWLRAAVVRPGNARVVHHSLVYFGTTGILGGLDGFFAGYVPGYEPNTFPEGTGKLLPQGTVLKFQMHYITDRTNETDQTQIGLYFMSAPPAHVLQTKSAFDVFFQIPARAPQTETTAQYTFTSNVLLYEMSPHMHLRGARFRYEAIYPDNTREILLSVPHYEFSWQTLYRLAQPKLLPAGTTLICTGAWDNSPQNTDNPNPAATVHFGEQTTDEMFIGYFNYAELP